MYYTTLENTDLNTICTAFNDAFSDYQVSTNISLKQFETMLKRRGYDPKLSVGAFDEQKLVGFVLNGLREWNSQKTIYDLGTGVIPQYRHRKIISTNLEMVKELCKENNINWYLLEVIQNNTNAFSLYQKQGFKITRSFECYKGMNINLKNNANVEIKYVKKFNESLWQKVTKFWSVTPSWQNSIDSINAVADEFEYVLALLNNEIAGYGVFEKANGSIVQLAVSPHYRKQGVASSILNSFITKYKVERLSMINVDSKSIELIKFLEHIGFITFVSQYEMIKEINLDN